MPDTDRSAAVYVVFDREIWYFGDELQHELALKVCGAVRREGLQKAGVFAALRD